MNSIKTERLWRLMSEHNFEVENPCLNADLVCVLCQKLMMDACHSACGCRYCYKCIADYLGDEDKFCPGDGDKCREEYLVLSTDVFRDRRINNRIAQVKVKCPHKTCGTFVELSNIEDHFRLCTQQSSECPYKSIGCDNNDESKDAIEAHLGNDNLTHSQLLMEWVHILKNEIDGMKVDYEKNKLEMKEELRGKDVKIDELEQRLSQLRNEIHCEPSVERYIEQSQAIIVEQSPSSSIASDGIKKVSSDFVWKVEDFYKKRGPTVFSDPFYFFDYKLCLSMFLYADSIGLNCVLMKGDKDDKIEWPMRHKVTLSILDQSTMTAYKTDTFQYDTFSNKIAFERPTSDRSNFIGANPFGVYSAIRDISTVVVNDSIVVSCVLTDK